jgi:DNA-binding transcriptional regulator YdaS (Cro superfamily)
MREMGGTVRKIPAKRNPAIYRRGKGDVHHNFGD